MTPVKRYSRALHVPFSEACDDLQKCRSLGDLSARYRSSHRLGALSYFGDPRSA
jgi:hypothetical protein